MVLSNHQQINGLKILVTELPKYGAQIIKFRHWLGGYLYKISWSNSSIYKDKIQPHNLLIEGSNKKYSWPFIDLFIGVNKGKKNLFCAYSIQKNEYPLKNLLIDNINIKVPTNGFRNYESFKKDSCMKIALEQEYSHKYEKPEKCIGEKSKYL